MIDFYIYCDTEKQTIQHKPVVPKIPGATPIYVDNTPKPTKAISSKTIFFKFIKIIIANFFIRRTNCSMADTST